ncbi:hypothetical protein CNYM01_11230 [Colletotrichum nymphaeae SA-01]|uniref:Uncharacterized protein n=1 Tax=Colletotrichum nymphaeae SA-01 TaxID=1460502 RepID=A0A135TUP1_9PEZI|nr:hypothetical protein CNYM01_11230 [Colletotrichum nymphaeae SA-01]
MVNTHEQQQHFQPLHRPTWRTSTALGRQRSRFQYLPAEVLLVIIEQLLQPEAKHGNLQDLENDGPSPSTLQRPGLPVLPSPTPNTAQAQEPGEARKLDMRALAALFYLGLLNARLRELISPMLESHARRSSSRSTTANVSPTSQTDPSGLYSYILIHSAIRGNLKGVLAALDHGADINADDGIDESLAANIVTGEPTGSCLTALHWAAFKRDTAMLRLLLDRGADVQRTAQINRKRLWVSAKALVSALGFALQANYRLLSDGMTEQQRQAFVVDRDTRDEEAVRILVEAGCPAFVMMHREREFNDACELERWGVARDVLANTEWRRRCAERDEYNLRPSAPLSLVRVVRGRNPSRRVMGYHTSEW